MKNRGSSFEDMWDTDHVAFALGFHHYVVLVPHCNQISHQQHGEAHASGLLVGEKPLHLICYYSTRYYNDHNSEILATNIGSSSFLGFIDLVIFFSFGTFLHLSFGLLGSSFGTLRWLHSVLAPHLESVVPLEEEQEAVYT